MFQFKKSLSKFSEVKKGLWIFKMESAFKNKIFSWFNTLEYIFEFINIMEIDTTLPGRIASQYE